MKTLFILPLIIFTFAVSYLFAGDTVKEEQVKVFGNCKQCKDRIESTLKIKEVKFAKWDKKSKMLRVAYQSDKISLDSLQQLVASVGHDTEKFKAPDSVYSELPGCCLYRDGEHTH
ncbi:MAG: ATPase [Bacteroidota bacterium]